MTNIVEYDLSFWIKQNVDETNAQKVCDEITKKLQDKGFGIISVSTPSLRTVGQAIKKESQAYLVSVIFSAGEGDLNSIKDLFAFNADVLRFMVIRKEIRPEKPRNKRTRTGFKKSEHMDKENIEETKSVCDPETPITHEEKVEEVKEQIIEENLVDDIKEEVVTEEPTTTEEKEIDLNELDKKLDELLN